MALVTIQRSPSPSNDPESDAIDGAEESGSSRSPLRQRSLSESYFTVKGAALILPQNDCSRRTSRKNHGGDMQHHLQTMLHLLRPEDKMKMAVKLENVVASSDHRYLALVSTIGRQDEEESIILGIDCKDTATIGLVIPILSGTKIRLDGDGGFSVQTHDGQYIFKPVSVQVMWSALQSLDKAVNLSDSRMYTAEGLSHTWISYYMSKIDSTHKDRISQWHMMEGVYVNFANLIPSTEDENEEVASIKRSITLTLYDVMMSVDLDVATCISLRNAVEAKLCISVKPYKAFLDAETMRILGQMDGASKITDVVYLGSEWNAANATELQELGIGYILNVTREIDNFFQGMFQYKNIRLLDVPESDLLKHWDKTYNFIDKARKNNSKVLIHCKMGISRSASTTMAFLMKDNNWCLDEAFKFVKDIRECVNPNEGFMAQLKTYEGILKASNQRHTFHNLVERDPKSRSGSAGTEDEEDFLEKGAYVGIEPSDLPLCKPKDLPEEEWIAQLRFGNVTIPIEKDFETGSRSADSMEESLPDIPSPTPETEHSTKTRSYDFSKSSHPHSGEVAGADLPYESSSEESNEDFGIDISRHTEISSSVPLNPNAFKDDFSWIKPQSDGETSPSIPQFDAPVLILTSDHGTNFDDRINGNIEECDNTTPPEVENQQTTNVEMEVTSMSPTKCNVLENLGINEYYTKEDIPWSCGKVHKIRNELVNTNSKDISVNIHPETSNANSSSHAMAFKHNQELETKVVKSSERTTPGMKCSHSCSELILMDCEIERPSKRQCPVSVYDKEQIELTEGIVRKTKMEIEERAKTTDGEFIYPEFSKPIQRSASLKEATEIAKARRAERRKTCSPIVSPPAVVNQISAPESSEVEPRPLLILDNDKTLPAPTPPVIAIGGVTLEESTDAETEDITVYRYGSEEVPLKSGIVKKHKQEYETRSSDTTAVDNIESDMCTSITDSKDSNVPITSHIPITQQSDCSDSQLVGKKDICDSKGIESQGHSAQLPVRFSKEKCPYNKEEMDYIKDIGSMLSHKSADDELDNVDSQSAVFNAVRTLERITKDNKPEKKIVIIDDKKSKCLEKSQSNETLKSIVVGQTSSDVQNNSEISERTGLSLDLKIKSSENTKFLTASPESVLKNSLGHRTTQLDSDQSVVKQLLGRFETKDTSPVQDNSKPVSLGVCVAKPETQTNLETNEPKTLTSETIEESDEDKHLLPQYVEMRNNLNHVHPFSTQRNRPKSSDIIHRRGLRANSVTDTPPSQRQSAGDEIRRIRRVQLGASHPLMRLGATPFYNTM